MADKLPPLPEIPLGRYQHYSGDVYELIGVGYHSETLEPQCVYISEKTNTLWVRPAVMWDQRVEVPRFKPLD